MQTREYSRLIVVDVSQPVPTVLVQRLTNGRIIFPGGKIEKGEYPITAIAREIFEETFLGPEKRHSLLHNIILGAQSFEIFWHRIVNGREIECTDFCFLLPWLGLFERMVTTKEPNEILGSDWIQLKQIAHPSRELSARIQFNTLATAQESLKRIPDLLTDWEEYL